MSLDDMPDQPTVNQHDEATPPEERPRRDARPLASVIILVVIVLVVMFLLRDCGTGSDGLDGGGAKTIERVQDAEPMPGAVSVWLSGNTTVERATEGAGVEALDLIALGGGRYIIQVTEGAEVDAAAEIASQPGVFDAGLVYEVDK